jgi:hypothetical protein
MASIGIWRTAAGSTGGASRPGSLWKKSVLKFDRSPCDNRLVSRLDAGGVDIAMGEGGEGG